MTTPDPQRAVLVNRIIQGDTGLAPLWFEQAVLDRYRAQTGARVMRTDTAGRVKSGDGWSLDFGIADSERFIHATVADLVQKLPATERQHWAQHAAALPMSRNFLAMRLGAGSCVDDGDLRTWPADAPVTTATF